MKNKQNIKYVGKYKRYCGQFLKSNYLKQKEQLVLTVECIINIQIKSTHRRHQGELHCCKLRCMVLLKTANCAITPKQPQSWLRQG